MESSGLVSLTLIIILLSLGGILFIGFVLTRSFTYPKSPYTGLPLRSADTLPRETKVKIYTFLKGQSSYNQPFKFKKATFCRETGRIFQNSIDWKGKMEVDWSFLMKRHHGQWMSWGSLSEELKRKVKARHTSLSGFQTERSSELPSPTKIEPLYVYSKPGPLYVDINQMALMGWKIVPDTELEVLIVQLPDR